MKIHIKEVGDEYKHLFVDYLDGEGYVKYNYILCHVDGGVEMEILDNIVMTKVYITYR